MTKAKDDERPAARPGERIAKLLARAGIASRREIERMIEEGRIALDGAVLTTPATIIASLAGVTVDGNPVQAAEATRLFLYHKPPGLLVTERDPKGRPTIYDRLPEGLPRVVPVGRLDLATEGLLLLTTDGGFKRELELPSTGVERAYRARAYGPVTQEQLEDLSQGIEIEGIRYGSIDANIERRTGANVWIEMTLTEGKNREVRRVLEHLGLQVSRLIRIRYGLFVLGDLQPGEVGEVKPGDLAEFRRTLKQKGGASSDVPNAPVAQPITVAPPRRAAAPAPRAPQPRGRGAGRFPVAPPEPRAERPARTDARTQRTPPRFERGATEPQRDERHRGERLFGKSEARPARGATERPARTATPARPERSRTDRAPYAGDRTRTPGARTPERGGAPRSGPAKPGKGPAGGRGHPPRAPRGGKR